MKGVWRILMALLVVSCGNDRTADEEDGFVSGPYRVWMETENDSMNIVRLAVDGEVVDSMTLPFPVYRIDGGDLDADGIPEVCIGVVKATKYWKDVDRRLFIYRLYHGRYIRPLWLGSSRAQAGRLPCVQRFRACNHRDGRTDKGWCLNKRTV